MKWVAIVLLILVLFVGGLTVGFRIVSGGWPWQPWGQGPGA